MKTKRVIALTLGLLAILGVSLMFAPVSVPHLASAVVTAPIYIALYIFIIRNGHRYKQPSNPLFSPALILFCICSEAALGIHVLFRPRGMFSLVTQLVLLLQWIAVFYLVIAAALGVAYVAKRRGLSR